MSTYSTKAIVLKKTKLKDSDLIFTLLLEDGSRTSAVAHGILKPKAKMGGTLQLFATVDCLLAKGRNLDTICEAESLDMASADSVDLAHSSAASCICELLCHLSLEGQSQPRLFELSRSALAAIARAPEDRIPLMTAAALIKMMSLVGYRPQFHDCAICNTALDDADRSPLHFSWADGGVVCRDCSPSVADLVLMEPELIDWMYTLLFSTFQQIAELPRPADEVGYPALRFCERWIADHVDIKLKSLAFMFIGW